MITDTISRLSPHYRGLRQRKAALMSELETSEGLEGLAFEILGGLTRDTELSRGKGGEPLSGADFCFELYRMSDGELREKWLDAQREAERLAGATNRLETDLRTVQDRMEGYELAVGRNLKRAGYAVIGAIIIVSLLLPACQSYLDFWKNHPARTPNYPISNNHPITRL